MWSRLFWPKYCVLSALRAWRRCEAENCGTINKSVQFQRGRDLCISRISQGCGLRQLMLTGWTERVLLSETWWGTSRNDVMEDPSLRVLKRGVLFPFGFQKTWTQFCGFFYRLRVLHVWEVFIPIIQGSDVILNKIVLMVVSLRGLHITSFIQTFPLHLHAHTNFASSFTTSVNLIFSHPLHVCSILSILLPISLLSLLRTGPDLPPPALLHQGWCL